VLTFHEVILPPVKINKSIYHGMSAYIWEFIDSYPCLSLRGHGEKERKGNSCFRTAGTVEWVETLVFIDKQQRSFSSFALGRTEVRNAWAVMYCGWTSVHWWEQCLQEYSDMCFPVYNRINTQTQWRGTSRSAVCGVTPWHTRKTFVCLFVQQKTKKTK